MTSVILPKGWKEIELGSVLKRVKRPVDLEPSTMYREIGIRSHGKGIFYKEERTGESIGEKSVFWIEPDCFIVNIVFAWEQAVAKTTSNENGMIASHRFPMYKPTPDKLNLDYLLYFFNSPRGKYLLGLASPGGAGRNKTLGQEEFLNTPIPLPPLEQQKRIVEILNTWDNAVALSEQLLFKKELLKKSLASKLLSQKMRFREFRQDDWKRESIGDVCVTFSGGTPNRSNQNCFGGDIPWIKSGELNQRVIFKTEETITALGLSNSSAKYVEPNTVLIAMYGATAGVVGITKIKATTNQAVLALIPKVEYLYNDFLYYAIANEVPEVLRLLQGAQPNLNAQIIKNSEINIPSLEEQKRIAEFLLVIDEELELLDKKISALKRQKNGLMQKLLTGQIRVKV